MDSSKGLDAPRRVAEETKRLYADLLSKPLDINQLARPSFKFIQEVAKTLITETRILRNVFNSSDFETENKTWDRRRKCEFVQKLIDFVANHKQPVVGCVAAKLVAGLDPIKTNELLQSLAKISQARLSGLDGNTKRPRTFTRQTPSSSSKQQDEKVREEQKETSSGKGARTFASTMGLKRNGSGEGSRGAKTKRLSTPGDRSTTSREPKTSNEKGSGPRMIRSSVSSVDEPPDSRSRLSSGTVASDEKSSARSPTEFKEKESNGTDESFSNQWKRNSASRLSSSLINQPNSHYIIVSESEIGKNMQQLRYSLEQLRSSLLEMGQFEKNLKVDLVAYLGDS